MAIEIVVIIILFSFVVKMFSKATKKFVKEIDPDGCLIPVSRLNESDNLKVLSLVIKRKPSWFWQQPKYMPTDFTLNDVLQGETSIQTGTALLHCLEIHYCTIY